MKWTHWFEPACVPGYAEKARIIRTSKWFKSFVKIETNKNYKGWERKEYLCPMLEEQIDNA